MTRPLRFSSPMGLFVRDARTTSLRTYPCRLLARAFQPLGLLVLDDDDCESSHMLTLRPSLARCRSGVSSIGSLSQGFLRSTNRSYIVPGASYLLVAKDACPGRRLVSEHEVHSISLQGWQMNNQLSDLACRTVPKHPTNYE